jgi:transposase-like protein
VAAWTTRPRSSHWSLPAAELEHSELAEIDMPRDRDSSFAPKIAAKRQRRLGGSMTWSSPWPPKA